MMMTMMMMDDDDDNDVDDDDFDDNDDDGDDDDDDDQVMTGLKNYLLVTGEGDLASLTTGMDPAEVEAALEEAVQELVVRESEVTQCLEA